MGIGLADARAMSLWEYEAMLTEYNARHDPKGTPVAKPSKAKVRSHLDRLAADPRFTS
jgi:hypothetical protein